MIQEDSARDDPPSFPELYEPLKRLNVKLSAIRDLTGDWSIETMPQWVSLPATTACNLRCPYCQTHGTEQAHQEFNHKSKRWDDARLEALARECLPAASEFNLTLSGEPFVIPDFPRKLEAFSHYGAKLDINTNASMFTPEVLARLLPIVGILSFSIDGATERTCEALRRGARFEDLLNNIRLTTRALELARDLLNPDVRIAFTVMASNLREMPAIVSLAHLLKVPAVIVHPVEIFSPHVCDEDIALHAPVYNACYETTLHEAERLGVTVDLPEPFPDVKPDARAPLRGEHRILLDNDVGPSPPLESYLEVDVIEEKARAIASAIRDQSERRSTLDVSSAKARLEAQMAETLGLLLDQHSSLEGCASELAYHCDYLSRRTFVDAAGDVTPCCIPTRPILGNTGEQTIEEIWNGERYKSFRRAFYSESPPECCRDCRFRVRIEKKDLLRRLEVNP